jgi:hypothetical protein
MIVPKHEENTKVGAKSFNAKDFSREVPFYSMMS